MKPDTSKMRKLGEKTIEVMEYGSGGYRTKKIKRAVYSKATLTKGHPIYWFELVNGIWKNTTKKGIKSGIVVTKNEFEKLHEKLQTNNSKHGREKVKVNGYTKHKWRCPKCGRAAPDDFCIVHGDVTAVDITKNAKIRKMALEYSTKTEKIEKKAKTKEKERKRKDIIGKQTRATAKKKKTKKKVSKPKTKEYTDIGMELEKLIAKKAEVKERQSHRTKRARSMDSKKRAKRVVKRDKYHLWLRHPERYDIEGVDT